MNFILWILPGGEWGIDVLTPAKGFMLQLWMELRLRFHIVEIHTKKKKK